MNLPEIPSFRKERFDICSGLRYEMKHLIVVQINASSPEWP